LELKIKNVIIWGHKPNSARNRLGIRYTATHSYIHQGFAKAFEYLGYKVVWLDSEDDVTGLDFNNSLFFTEGQVDDRIPICGGANYVLHHCDTAKYIDGGARILNLCNYVKFCEDGISFNYPGNLVERINKWTYLDVNSRAIYQPWATDLLPSEIDSIGVATFYNEEMYVNHVGSTRHDNLGPSYKNFKKICRLNGKNFRSFSGLSSFEMIEKVKSSYISVDLRGDWHRECGYMPDRIFKNLSYGKITGTNSPWVHLMFDGQIPFGKSIDELFENTLEKNQTIHPTEVRKLQRYVRDNHTLVNRAMSILELFTHL
jgi:hypothetical protein